MSSPTYCTTRYDSKNNAIHNLYTLTIYENSPNHTPTYFRGVIRKEPYNMQWKYTQHTIYIHCKYARHAEKGHMNCDSVFSVIVCNIRNYMFLVTYRIVSRLELNVILPQEFCLDRYSLPDPLSQILLKRRTRIGIEKCKVHIYRYQSAVAVCRFVVLIVVVCCNNNV